MSRAQFLEIIEKIRCYIFPAKEQSDHIDEEFTEHARFLQQTAIYKTLKQAVKVGDTGMIKRVYARCSLLFHGSRQPKYAFLSLYVLVDPDRCS